MIALGQTMLLNQFQKTRVPLVPYQTNSEILKELDERIGDIFSKSEVRDFFKKVRENVFNDFTGFDAELFCVDPEEITYSAGKVYPFLKEISDRTNLSRMTASAIIAIILNFKADLFLKETVLTHVFQIKCPQNRTWILSCFTLESDCLGRPIIRIRGFDSESFLKAKKFNYLMQMHSD